MEVRAGYKLTEVGVVPAEWEITEVGALCSAVLDCHHSTPVWTKSGAVVIRNQNIRNGKLDLSDPSFTDEKHFMERTRRAVPTFGDLVITREAPMGLVCMIPKGLRCCLGQRMVLLRVDGDAANIQYLLYALMSETIQRAITVAGGTGSTVSNLRIPVLKGLPIAAPNGVEQLAIAAALSDVDALLAGLDRLIAKKRDLKQAAMQQLLTGQTRLPGFQGEWEVKRLGELGVFLKGSGVKKDQAQSGDLLCVRYGEIYTHHHECIRQFNSWISPEVARTAIRLKQGDLLFAGSGETKAEIGKCVAFVDACEAYAGGDIVILRPVGTNPTFMGYYLNTAPICAQKASRGQGDAVVHISAAALGSIAVKVPALAEQSAIATILSDIDAELTALEARRAKTRALKQAMMQELLTGRTRLL